MGDEYGDPLAVTRLAGEVNELLVFWKNMHEMLDRLFMEDHAARIRLMRMLEGSIADRGGSIDMAAALDQALDERDAARAAAKEVQA